MRPSSKLSYLALAALLALPGFAAADPFEWDGSPIVAGDDPSFFPKGTATFDIPVAGTLTILLSSDSPAEGRIGEVLTGLLFDIDDPTVAITPLSAELPTGSSLIGAGATADTDVSSEWFYKDGITAGVDPFTLVPYGEHGVGIMGDINFGADTFGKPDAFTWDGTDVVGNLFGPEGPNGIEVGIVGPNLTIVVGVGPDGFKNQGPVAQNETLLTLSYTGDLQLSEISNVTPLFGTDGAPIPEPASVALLGVAAAYAAARRRRRT